MPKQKTETNESLVAEFQAGDESAFERLLERNIKLVWKVIRQYRFERPGIDVEDLLQEGRLTIYKCAKAFDPAFKCKFTTATFIAIYRRLMYFTTNGHLIHTPGKSTFTEAACRARDCKSLDHCAPAHDKTDEAPVEVVSEEAGLLRAALARIGRRDHRSAEVVRLRMAGHTLAQCGTVFGVSKERIRQIEQKVYKRLPVEIWAVRKEHAA